MYCLVTILFESRKVLNVYKLKYYVLKIQPRSQVTVIVAVARIKNIDSLPKPAWSACNFGGSGFMQIRQNIMKF
jgi:hypothetical protein